MSWVLTNAPNTMYWNWISSSADGRFQNAVAYNDSIYISTDYGKIWNVLSNSPKLGWYQVAISDNANYQIALDGDSNSLYLSSDQGNTWNIVNSLIGKTIVSITMSKNGQHQMVGCYNDYVYFSADYGNTWNSITSLGVGNFYTVAISYDGSVRCVMSNNDALYWSINGLDTWNYLTISSNYLVLTGNGQYIYLYDNIDSLIQISTLNGTQNKKFFPYPLFNYAVNQDGSVIIATDGNRIYESDDYGNNWSNGNESPYQNFDDNKNWFGLSLNDNGIIKSSAVAGSGGIYYSGTEDQQITLTINVTTGSVILPIIGINELVTVDWGDGNIVNLKRDLPFHKYANNGEYTVTILGSFNQFGSNNIMSDYNTGLVSFVYTIQIPSLISFENAFAKVYSFFTVNFGNNTSNVINMSNMFYNCKYFNSPLTNINTNSVTNMSNMFYNACRFNQDISGFATNNVTNMDYMFYSAQNFDNDLSLLRIDNLNSAFNMLAESGLSTTNYDNLLISFADQLTSYQILQNGYYRTPISIVFGAGNIKYSTPGENAYNILTTTYHWQIYDGGYAYCFNKGTKILVLENDTEIYKNIEDLCQGNLVKTFSCGYKKITNIVKGVFKNDTSNFNKCMYKMKKCGDMLEDLIITGSHSILVDILSDVEKKNMLKMFGKLKMIEGKYLLLSGFSNKLEKIKNKENYEHYNIKLEGNADGYGIYANGVLCESLYDSK
jgi:surface protein